MIWVFAVACHAAGRNFIGIGYPISRPVFLISGLAFPNAGPLLVQEAGEPCPLTESLTIATVPLTTACYAGDMPHRRWRGEWRSTMRNYGVVGTLVVIILIIVVLKLLGVF